MPSLSRSRARAQRIAATAQVWLGYCSGDSFLGAAAAPVAVNTTRSVLFRGRAILTATLNDLAAAHGLARASAVLLKGCSAGGVATYSNADAVALQLAAIAPAARFAALPGAGMFLDLASFAGPNTNEFIFRYIFSAANCSATADGRCQAALGAADAWRCLYAATLLPFISTPLFIANSLADAASQSFIMGLGCNPAAGTCSAAQLAYLDAFGATMIANASLALAPHSRHGAFLVSCSVHMLENVDGAVADIRVQGRTLAETFGAWWTRSASEPRAVVDALWTQGAGPFGGNADCGAYGPLPSRP